MTLLIDRKNEMESTRGVHALIVGISEYDNLPSASEILDPRTFMLRRLSCAAYSAYSVYEALVANSSNLVLPIKTLRLLVAPSLAEISADPRLGLVKSDVTWQRFRDSVREWRDDASASPTDVTFFYFAGHGIQQPLMMPTLLMQDFGGDELLRLSASVNFQDLWLGMNVSLEEMRLARNQYYFIDCCRTYLNDHIRQFKSSEEQHRELETLGNVPPFWDLIFGTSPDSRHAPVFYAASSGSAAFGAPAGRTIFVERLLECLQDDALKMSNDGTHWQVDTTSLATALSRDASPRSGPSKSQIFELGGVTKLSENERLLIYKSSPRVKRSLRIEPDSAVDATRVAMWPAGESAQDGLSFPTPVSPHPFVFSIHLKEHVIEADLDGENAEDARRMGCRGFRRKISALEIHLTPEIQVNMC